MLVVLALVIILGSVMYLVEKKENGFESIPDSIYWAIVTITTVGYGDIAPVSPLGKFIASIIMLLGYGIIAVPTGIVTTEMLALSRLKKHGTRHAPGAVKRVMMKMLNFVSIAAKKYKGKHIVIVCKMDTPAVTRPCQRPVYMKVFAYIVFSTYSNDFL